MNKSYANGYNDAAGGFECQPPLNETEAMEYCEGYRDGFGLHRDGFQQPCGPNDTNADYHYC